MSKAPTLKANGFFSFMELTQKYIQDVFDYKDGVLYWKIKKRYGLEPGTIAGNPDKKVNCIRHRIHLNQKSYYRARLVFLYFNGYLPDFVDHEDGNTLNDKINNLRDATKSQNGANRKKSKNMTSKYLGVCLHYGKYWNAKIVSKGFKKHIGRFKTEEDAALAYNKEAVKHHGEFARLNIITP